MRVVIPAVFSLSLFVLTVLAILLIPFPRDDARAQSCSISICKSAEGAGDTPFTFHAERPNDNFDFNLVAGSECLFLGLDPSIDLLVTESLTEGWELADIDCSAAGLEISPRRRGIFVECPAPGGGGTCTFINAPEGSSIASIPTLSEWGMFAAAAGLGLAGAFYAVRRRRTAGV